MSYTSRSSAGSALPTFVGWALFVLVVFGWPWLVWGPSLAHGWTLFLIGAAPVLIFAAAIIALILVAILVNRSGMTTLAVIGGLALVGLAITTGVRFNYDTHSKYVADIKIVTAEAPEYQDRAPYDVATASSNKLLGDTTGTALNSKIVVDDGDHGTWSTLIERKGFMAGYESVQVIDVPTFGAADAKDVTTCNFDPNTAEQRLGGFLPHESLDLMVNANTPANVTFDTADVYSYCEDDDTPKIVIPLKSVDGFWVSTQNVWGAAVYDGKTGTVTVHTDTSDIPGPVYPQSLAVIQREALDAIGKNGGVGTFDDHIFNRNGFEATDDTGSNSGEYTLRYKDDTDAGYATPLTPRGDSVSVIALANIDATSSKSGERNLLTVYRYEKGHTRSANSSIAQELKSTYSWMPDWASGLEIFEIVPGTDGNWVASIGQTQNVVYRAVIDQDGNAVLYDADGDEVTRTGTTTPSNGGSVDGDESPATADSDLSKMSPAQLRELATRVLDELAARATLTQ